MTDQNLNGNYGLDDNDLAGYTLGLAGELSFQSVEKALEKVGATAAQLASLSVAGKVYGVVVELPDIVDAVQQGDLPGAVVETSGAAGAIAGGLLGAKLGAVAGAYSGVPAVSLAAGVVGGVVGAVIGEAALESMVADILDYHQTNSDLGDQPHDYLPNITDKTIVITVPNLDGSLTTIYDDPVASVRVKTVVQVDSTTGEHTPVSTTVPTNYNTPTGTETDLLIGNTYVPGNVNPGEELNALDQIAEEANPSNSPGGSGSGDNSSGNGDTGIDPDTSGGGGNDDTITIGDVSVDPGSGTYPEENYDTPGVIFPIILDLDGDGVEVTFGQPTFFDWDGDGYKEQTSWVGKDDGFLVLDLAEDGSRGNGDGKIDQARELEFSLWGNDGDTDLQGLRRAFDDNNDGILNDQDDVWDELRVWKDSNQNGETDDGELRTLAQWGISQINLGYDNEDEYSSAEEAFSDTSDNITVFGNTLHGLASFTMNGEVIEGGVGDVALSYDARGWREVATATGFSIELEGGEAYNYAVLDGTGSASINLVTDGLDGAIGDARDNLLTANSHTRAVQISGDDGDDVITGGHLDDMLSGGDGNDELNGGDGDDVLFGGDGRDELVAGAGNDYLDAGANSDGGWQYLIGQDGNDTYSYGVGDGDVYVTAGAEGASTGDADRVVFRDLLLSDVTFSTQNFVNGGVKTCHWGGAIASHLA